MKNNRRLPIPQALKPILFRVLLIVIGVPLTFFFLTRGMEYYWGDHFFEKRFETFDIGQTRYDVIGLLGKPDAAADEYALDEEVGFREEFRVGKHPGSEEYLFWYRGDSVFVVGLDASGKITLMASGIRL